MVLSARYGALTEANAIDRIRVQKGIVQTSGLDRLPDSLVELGFRLVRVADDPPKIGYLPQLSVSLNLIRLSSWPTSAAASAN